MKRFIGLLLIVVLLTGCGKENNAMEQAIKFRNSLLQSSTASFDAEITAEYEDILLSFKMNCVWNSADQMKFTVLQPESISGISGIIAQENGKIEFDEKALFFDVMADGTITPVSAPWFVLRAMSSGYIKGAGERDNGYIIQLDDSYQENALNINLQMNDECSPKFAEVFYNGRRVVSISFENFTIL